MTALTPWQNFYEIVGSSAGALIGLQFVVLSLITPTRTARLDAQAGSAFGSPTIVHFATVLAIAAIICAPWDDPAVAAVVWGLVGVGGIIYVGIVIHRIRAQPVYEPAFEDWLFHILSPCAAYLSLAVSAVAARFRLRDALFAVAAAALVLLFSGIHNAWDTVTYYFFARARDPQPDPASHAPKK